MRYSRFVFSAMLLLPAFAAAQEPQQNTATSRLEIRAVDEQGNTVQDFEALVVVDGSYLRWRAAKQGTISILRLEYNRMGRGDVVVRATGYATAFVDTVDVPEDGALEVKLSPGREVLLSISAPHRKDLPSDLFPAVYIARHAAAFRMHIQRMEQPEYDRAAEVGNQLNCLGVRRTDDGHFAFRAGDWKDPLVLSINHPEVIRFYESQPIELGEIGEEWNVALPIPATWSASFRPGFDQPTGKDLPYNASEFRLLRRFGAMGYNSAVRKSYGSEDWQTTITNLAPGEYLMAFSTQSSAPPMPSRRPLANPGNYSDIRTVTLGPGQAVEDVFVPHPLVDNAFRGKLVARVTISAPTTQELAGKPYYISYSVPYYGEQTVAEGTLDASGRIELKDLIATADQTKGGTYSVEVDGESLGTFPLAAMPETQEFIFHLPPREGDQAPEVEVVDLKTGEPARLAKPNGKVTLIEFWATWCGPCQEPMKKLAKLTGERSAEWGDRVEIVAVSIDDEADTARAHIEREGWQSLAHRWSPVDQSLPPAHSMVRRQATGAYVVHGIPTALLLDGQGVIRWRGHPASIDLDVKIKELLAE